MCAEGVQTADGAGAALEQGLRAVLLRSLRTSDQPLQPGTMSPRPTQEERIEVLKDSQFEHGTRSRYKQGCKCDDCRTANTAYVRHRKMENIWGRTNKVIDAYPARRHLFELEAQGIGLRTIAEITGCGRSYLREVRNGARERMREQTLARILNVSADAVSDGTLIDAKPSWRLLRDLFEQGWTKSKIALLLGNKTPRLQIGKKKITARTALKISRLHRKLTSPGWLDDTTWYISCCTQKHEVSHLLGMKVCPKCSKTHVRPERVT